MIVPLLGEAEATLAGASADGTDLKLHLVLGNAAWVQVERALGGKSYLDVIGSLITAEVAGESAPLETTRAVLWGATRKHHGSLTIDQCGDIVIQFGQEVLPALGEAMRGSVKFKETAPGEV